MAKKKKRPAQRPIATDPRLRDALDRVDFLTARGRWAEARKRLEDLIGTYPHSQEPLRKLIEVGAALDDAHLYQHGSERLFKLCPNDRDLPYVLTRAYMRNHLFALALSMGRRALARDSANEKAPKTRKLVADLEPLVNQEITRLGLDGPDGLECLTLHDQFRSNLAQGDYERALQVGEALLKRRPRFAPAYNNSAGACYHLARLTQAIDLVQRLLAFEPDNVFALCNLVRFLYVSGKVDEANRHAERLKTLKPEVKSLAVKQAETFAWLGDDAAVLAVFDQSRHLEDAPGHEDDALLYHLAAVASYRQGREEQALTRWRFALRAVQDFELARDNLDDLQRPARERNAPWSYGMDSYVPYKLIDELVERMAAARDKGDAEAGLREAQQYLQVHPELEGLMPLLLDRSDQAGREVALRLAGLFRTPAMLRAMHDFALGQRGPDQLRLQAAELASQAGLLPGGTARFWLDGKWHDAIAQRFEIHGEVVERSHAPGVMDLLTQGGKAMQAGNPARAEQLFRQALAIDPNDPVALNNLAAACAHLGRTDESEAISIRLHELHPDYLFARTALASLAVSRGEFDQARKLLEPLVTRQRMHVAEFSALCMAQLNLHLATGDRKQAENWLGMWRTSIPRDPSIRA